MDTTKTGFFEEAPGQKSSMRLFSGVLLAFFCAFNFYYIRHHDLSDTVIVFDLVLLTGVFAPKYMQKVIELRLGNNTPTDKPNPPAA